MAKFTRVVKATSQFPTLRTTIPRSMVKHFKIVEGDLLLWQVASVNGEKIALVTKHESNTPFTMTGSQKFELTNGSNTPDEDQF